MPRTNRRRMLIWIGTLAFGASGVVASGAFSTASQGSLGDNWIQVAGTDQAVSFASPQQIDTGDGSDGESGDEDDDTSDEGALDQEVNDGEEQTNDDTDEETDEQPQADSEDVTGDDGSGDGDDGGDGETVITRVQAVVEPNNLGNAVNGSGSESWSGQIVASEVVRGTNDGFFLGVRARDVNKNATSTVGRLNGDYPNGEVAFIIVNVGPAETGAPTGVVSLTATLLAAGDILETDQLRFPYRVVDTSGATVSRGLNLFSAGGVTLADGHVIEVVIVIDTTSGADDLGQIDTIQFTAAGVGS